MTKMLVPLIYVGLGGLLGAVFRYLTTLATQGVSMTFPWSCHPTPLTGSLIDPKVHGTVKKEFTFFMPFDVVSNRGVGMAVQVGDVPRKGDAEGSSVHSQR